MGDEIDILLESNFFKRNKKIKPYDCNKKMDNVIDFLSKIKPYDISEIYKIENRHPFQDLLPCLREQISEEGNLEKFKINGWVGEGGRELEEFFILKYILKN